MLKKGLITLFYKWIGKLLGRFLGCDQMRERYRMREMKEEKDERVGERRDQLPFKKILLVLG